MISRFAGINLDQRSNDPDYKKLVETVTADDDARMSFLKACLGKLGLSISEDSGLIPSLSRLHLSSLHHTEVPELLVELQDIITVEDGEEYIKGEHDTFHIEKQESRWSLHNLVKSLPMVGSGDVEPEDSKVETPNQLDAVSDEGIVDYQAIIKRIIPHETEWPGSKETPYFSHHAFYANLRRYQSEYGSESDEFGNTLLYGEVVTSTNSILEKYVHVEFRSLC
jgi:biotin--protein ligase